MHVLAPAFIVRSACATQTLFHGDSNILEKKPFHVVTLVVNA